MCTFTINKLFIQIELLIEIHKYKTMEALSDVWESKVRDQF